MFDLHSDKQGCGTWSACSLSSLIHNKIDVSSFSAGYKSLHLRQTDHGTAVDAPSKWGKVRNFEKEVVTKQRDLTNMIIKNGGARCLLFS